MFKRLITLLAGLSLAALNTPLCGNAIDARIEDEALLQLATHLKHADIGGQPSTESANQEVNLTQALISQQVGGDDANSLAVKHLFRLLNAESKKQQRMKDALTPDLRGRIDVFMKQYSEFVASVHAPHVVYKLGSKLLTELGSSVAEEPESISTLRILLDESLQAQKKGAWGVMFDNLSKVQKSETRQMLGDFFAGMVIGSTVPNAKPRGGQGEKEYSMQDLIDLSQALTVAQNDVVTINVDQVSFNYFAQYITALVKEDIQALAKVSFAYLEKEYLTLTGDLFGLQEELFKLFEDSTGRSAAVEELPLDDSGEKISHVERTINKMNAFLNDSDQRHLYSDNPYVYWLIQLKKQEGSCTSYAFIKRRFNAEGISKDYFQFFRLFAHAYEFCHNWLKIYDADAAHYGLSWYGADRGLPMLANLALTSSVAANYFFNVQNVMRNSTYYDVLLTKGAIADERTAIKAFVADYIGMAAAAPMLIGAPISAVSLKSKLSSSAEQFFASWSYYYIFYDGMFNRNAIFKPANADGTPAGPDAGVRSIWPTEYGLFRKAMFGLIEQSVDFISQIAEASCYQTFDPERIDDLNSLTFGIVNPTALRYVSKAFLPMLLLNSQVSFLRGNMTEGEWQEAVTEQYNLVPNGYATAIGMTPASYYAERVLIIYACSTLGYNAGYLFGDYFHDEILNGLDKGLRGFANALDYVGIGKGDNETIIDTVQFSAQLYGDSLIEQGVQLIKAFMWPSPEMEQAFVPFIRGFLLDHGYLKTSHDERAYREALVNMTLSRLARYRYIDYTDAAVYARTFKTARNRVEEENAIEEICACLSKDIKRTLVCMGTGVAGQAVTGWATGKVYESYGPVLPKVRKLFQ